MQARSEARAHLDRHADGNGPQAAPLDGEGIEDFAAGVVVLPVGIPDYWLRRPAPPPCASIVGINASRNPRVSLGPMKTDFAPRDSMMSPSQVRFAYEVKPKTPNGIRTCLTLSMSRSSIRMVTPECRNDSEVVPSRYSTERSHLRPTHGAAAARVR